MMNRRYFMQSVATGASLLAAPSVFAQGSRKLSLTGVDSNGKPISLESFAGKLCLVSFFTAGCNLCTHDLKLMREFYLGNKQNNFVLLGVNLDTTKQDFTDYLHLVDLAIPPEQRFPLIWRNAPKHVDTFGPITRQPTHFVLDKTQQLAFKREGTFQPDDWDKLWTKLSG